MHGDAVEYTRLKKGHPANPHGCYIDFQNLSCVATESGSYCDKNTDDFGGLRIKKIFQPAKKLVNIVALNDKIHVLGMKRYKENPFLDGMIVPVSKKQVYLSRLGHVGDVFINQSTGEVHGTHVVTYRKVDSDEFVKLFSRNIALTFNLSSAGIKAFNVLVWTVQSAIQRDIVALDKFALDDFMEQNQELKITLRTFQRGLLELENAKIIAKNIRQGWYFINPNFIFNGDRIAFTALFEREKQPNQIEHTTDGIEHTVGEQEEEG